MARHFTHPQAERVLPEIEAALREALFLKSEFEGVEAELQQFIHRVQMLGGSQVDPTRVLALQGRREALASRLRESIEQVHSYGCQIKDLDIGLIDFPTFYRGEEVLLCWKLGETGIRFWHGLAEGFRGRREIDQDFLDNHGAGQPE
jgi:hypothetical protein